MHTWAAVWPNLLASLLWVPATMVHVTRSNRKHLKIFLGREPGVDEKENTDD